MERYSVLMSVYGKERPEYFDLSLKSMIEQSVLPDEIVIVKDGPISKQLQAVIDKYTRGKIPIVQVQLKENRGLGEALNVGIDCCKNELIARMDTDDYSMPIRCELQLKAFADNPALDIVGCQADEFVGNIDNIIGCRSVKLTNSEIHEFGKMRSPFNHPTVMYRKSTIVKVGKYPNYRKNQDCALWIKLLSSGSVCSNLSEHVFRFRFDEGTYKKRKTWLHTKCLLEIWYNAWREGYNTSSQFLMIACIHVIMYLIPVSIQRIIYRNFIRR